jgi:formate hydrogenlyase transcriptional activator
MHTLGVQSMVSLPLVSQGSSVGLLLLGSADPKAFMDESRAILRASVRFSGHCCAIQYRQLTLVAVANHLSAERDQNQMLLEITNILANEREPRKLFQAVNRALRAHLKHDYLSLGLLDPVSDTVHIHFLDFPSGKGVIHEDMTYPRPMVPWASAFDTGRSIYLDWKTIRRGRQFWSEQFQAEGLKSLFCAPLKARGRVFGILNFGTLNFGSLRPRAFDAPEERAFLERITAQVAIAIENALAYQEIEALKDQILEEKLYFEEEVRRDFTVDEIIGNSLAIKEVFKQIHSVSSLDATVLLLGETGTGKELLARAIHERSPRRGHTFVRVNCAALPAGLIESELFGHEKGAFTGAITQRVGRMELAHHGTLFLDEIGDLPLEIQPKLLRAVQEREFERLGGSRTIKVDFRLIVATNRDLARMVEEGTFRSDLYYRLNVFPIHVPPLRERVEDIPPLVRHFVHKFAARIGRRIDSIPKKAMAAMVGWPWPGNIRELENLIERSVILSEGGELRVPLKELRTKETYKAAKETLADMERGAILEALKASGGRVSGPGGAAAQLGLPRTTLQARMKKLGIKPKFS